MSRVVSTLALPRLQNGQSVNFQQMRVPASEDNLRRSRGWVG